MPELILHALRARWPVLPAPPTYGVLLLLFACFFALWMFPIGWVTLRFGVLLGVRASLPPFAAVVLAPYRLVRPRCEGWTVSVSHGWLGVWLAFPGD